MADLDKVIKGLEYCIKPNAEFHCLSDSKIECPYHDECLSEILKDLPIANQMHKDALELLKAQEPMAPVYDQLLTQEIPRCGKCGYRLVKGNDKYCCRCGQAVKWDG